jgi:broad specificity phosphatase PhoE
MLVFTDKPKTKMTKSSETSQIAIHGPEIEDTSAQRVQADSLSRLIPDGLRVEDIRAPEADSFKQGDCLMVLQVNAKDIRESEDAEIGSLYPESAIETRENAHKFFSELFAGMDEPERASTKILVVSSVAKLRTPVGVDSEKKRAFETAREVLSSIGEVLDEFNLSKEQVVNNTSNILEGEPFEDSRLVDLEWLHKPDDPQSAEFVRRMKEQYGAGYEPWKKYEADEEPVRSARIELGIEGREEIADRVKETVDGLLGLSKDYLKEFPRDRLVIWVVGHYDNISPFVLRDVIGVKPTEALLPANKGSGIVLHRSAATGQVHTKIGGTNYSVAINT